MKEINIHIGQRIKKWRTDLNLTQTDLSKAIGHKSAAYIAFIENGERNISAKDLYKLSQYLIIPISFLYPSHQKEEYHEFVAKRKLLKISKIINE